MTKLTVDEIIKEVKDETPEMRIIVAGSRNFSDFDFLCSSLDSLISDHPGYKIVIVSGTAHGADEMGEKYAVMNGFDVAKFPAQWDLYGKRAGFIRNQEMLDYILSDGAFPYLLAFWDGESKGTKHMLSIAAKAGISKKIIKFEK